MSKLADVLSAIKEKETLVGTPLKDVQTEIILHYKRISKLVQGGVHHMVNAGLQHSKYVGQIGLL
jgi:hypothetical protein